MNLALPNRKVTAEARDAILYALCCGAGDDLSLVHEGGLRIIPSFGQNLCFDDSWMETGGVDLARVVHGGLDLCFARPFAPGSELMVRPRIAGLIDKGPRKAALILLETELADPEGVLFTSLSTLFVMGGGGFGGDRGIAAEVLRIPDTAPDEQSMIETRPDSPLFFRLLGDRNGLHALPDVAQAAGFDRPIMHGANTFGLLCHEVLTRFCEGDPSRMRRFAARFSGPLYPGEELQVSWWKSGDEVRFAAFAKERAVKVLDGGLAEIS